MEHGSSWISRFVARYPCREISILLLDDEDAFRESLAENLRMDGHEVREFRAPGEVPLEAHADRVGIVVTDYEMPGAHGIAFSDVVHSRNPEMPVVLVTTHWTQTMQQSIDARPWLHLYTKPLAYDELHVLVHRLAG